MYHWSSQADEQVVDATGWYEETLDQSGSTLDIGMCRRRPDRYNNVRGESVKLDTSPPLAGAGEAEERSVDKC